MRYTKRLVALMAMVALVLVACGVPAPQVEHTATGEDAAQADVVSQTTDQYADEDAGEDAGEPADEPTAPDGGTSLALDEDATYTSKEEVALYLHTFGHLPSNYVTKDEAEDAGWKTEGLDLSEAVPGKSIGGDRFGNREGLLPRASGRTYYECDIDYPGHGSRGPKRLVYSNDGLIYYTQDHYQTFELLYGEES